MVVVQHAKWSDKAGPNSITRSTFVGGFGVAVPDESVVPTNVDVVSLVMLSVALVPVSLAESRSGADAGADGLTLSCVYANPVEQAERFPLESAACA